MDIRLEKRGAVKLMACSGAATTPDGKQTLEDAFASSFKQGDRKFIVDMREVPFMDSPTIGALMVNFKRAADDGGAVKLVLGTSGKIREILELTGLNEVVEIFDETERAVASFATASA